MGIDHFFTHSMTCLGHTFSVEGILTHVALDAVLLLALSSPSWGMAVERSAYPKT